MKNFNRFLPLILVAFLASSTAFAQMKMPDLNLNKQDIRIAKNNNSSVLSLSDIYESLPNIDACVAGTLKASEKLAVVNYINQIRAIHGLKPVSYDNGGDEAAQNGALICVANGALDHTPPNTAECFSDVGYLGTSLSNLYMSSGSSMESVNSITGWMIDDNSGIAATRCGHRRAIINPFVTQIAFGRSEGKPKIGGSSNIIAMALKYGDYTDGSIADQPVDYVAYPQNNYPIKLVNKSWLLSFSVITDKTKWYNNKAVDYTNYQIEVKDATGKSLSISDVEFDFEGWGSMPNCLVWKAAGLQNEMKYNVTISNLVVNGQEKSYTYWFKLTDNLAGSSPEIPTLSSPENGKKDVQIKANLSWKATLYAQMYEIQISKTDDFAVILETADKLAQTSYQALKLEANTTYYWRIRAKNDNGTSEWSSVRSFTTSSPAPSKPALQSPAAGTKNLSLTPELQWTEVPNAETYSVEIATKPAFGGVDVIFTNSELSTNKLVVPAGKLVAANKYYWRVTAYSSGGSSPFSDAWDFETKAKAPAPVVPVLSVPANNATNIDPVAELKWIADPNADTYELKIADDNKFTDFSLVFDTTNITGASYTATNGKLSESTTYFWKMRAVGTGGTSAWSTIWSFTTGKKTSVRDEVSAQHKLLEFPNPASTSVTISFDLNEADMAVVKVFDLKGNEVGTLFNGSVNSGSNRINLNLATLSSGTYLYRIILSNIVLSGSFEVVK